MKNNRESYWIKTLSPSKKFASLTTHRSTDVAIVGGGITGITAACLLKQQGKKVILIDQNRIGHAETGHTTGHLTFVLDTRYSKLISDFGHDYARLVYQSKLFALQQIKNWVETLKIDCDFEPVPAYLYSQDESGMKIVLKEKKACDELGIPAKLTTQVPLPFPIKNAIQFVDQYQFHASKYIQALASWFNGDDCAIFEDTQAIQVKESEPCEVHTKHGILTADHVIMATHSPTTGGIFMNTKVAAYRSYAIAAHLKKPPHETALYWDTADPYHYIRKNREVWIIGGKDHKTGQIENEEKSLETLEGYVKDKFGINSISAQWSGQIIEPIDGLPFIGKIPGTPNRYLATGFSGNGLTFGTLAGCLISDLILKKENPWKNLYNPNRFKIMASAGSYINENKDFPICFIKDRIKSADVSNLYQISKDCGATIQMNHQKVAAYRDHKGNLHTYSAVCPHQGCHVHWNGMEKTWDCPCHGSRFSIEGKVLNGPSLKDLEPVSVTEENLKKNVR